MIERFRITQAFAYQSQNSNAAATRHGPSQQGDSKKREERSPPGPWPRSACCTRQRRFFDRQFTLSTSELEHVEDAVVVVVIVFVVIEAVVVSIELAGEVNTAMPDYVIARVVESLNLREKSLKGSRILLMGVAYKKGVDDMRESPSLRLIELLRAKGAEVVYHDPFVPSLPPTRKYRYRMASVPLNVRELKKADLVLIATAHDEVDYDKIGQHADVVVDTRNAMADVKRPKALVVKA